MALPRTTAAPVDDSSDDGGKWRKEHGLKSNCRWTVGCYFKAFCSSLLVLVSYFKDGASQDICSSSKMALLEFIISLYSIVSIYSYGEKWCDESWGVNFQYRGVATAGDECSSHVDVRPEEDNLEKLDDLLPDVKGRILEHLGYENITKLKFLSKNWKALIESVEFIQCNPCNYPHCWTVRWVLIKALLLLSLASIEVLLNDLILIYALFSICYQKPVPKCSEDLVEDEVQLQKLELDSLLPEVKGRILEHLDHEDIFKLKSLSKSWKALIERVEFIQALSLKAKPVLTACSFFIDKGVWHWAAFDPNWISTSGLKGKWRKLPPLTFLPPNCDPDPDLFKQFLFCANDGLVCMNFSKSPHEERLIVFNPLTQKWKELPPLLHRRNPVLMHMYVDRSSKSYHILAAGSSASGEESLSRITELFDSRTGQWERMGDFPGPAFALNEYQSGVFHHGNIFCIGFMELGDQTVKGILGYNVEEGIWSTKWTDRGLPNSTILQLVENNGELFLFSERDNGPLTEHWVDRIEWTQSEGESEEKIDAFKLVNVLKKEKSGGRSLEVYPEFALVPFSESQLCIYNTVDHSGEVYDLEAGERCEALPDLPDGFRGELGLFSLNPISFAIEPRFSSKV